MQEKELFSGLNIYKFSPSFVLLWYTLLVKRFLIKQEAPTISVLRFQKVALLCSVKYVKHSLFGLQYESNRRVCISCCLDMWSGIEAAESSFLQLRQDSKLVTLKSCGSTQRWF